jgi:type II secretory pathway pseudopilin PulG
MTESMNNRYKLTQCAIVLLLAIISLGSHPAFTQRGVDKRKASVQKARSAPEKLLSGEAKAATDLAEKFRAAANRVDDEHHVGTMHNEINVPQHSCYVLGRLLGQDAYVRHRKFTYTPNFKLRTSENAYDLRVMAISLDNFANVANLILEMTREERIVEWNLDCVGNYKIPRSRWIKQSKASTFYQVKNDGKVLQILGNIEAGFSDKIISAIESNPDVETIALGSAGGSVNEALEAGRYIRSKGLGTILWNNCYSACPLVFMGGVERTIWSPYPSLGLHQVYSKDGATPLDSRVYKDIFAYLTDMGVDTRFVLTNMWKASPNTMNVLEVGDNLCETRIATWVQRICSSEENN